MNQITPKNLRDEFAQILTTGDETKARQFLITHFKEFPEKTQDIITVSLLEEALQKRNIENDFISDFQDKAIAAMNTLGIAREETVKYAKLAEIKENVKK